MGGLRERKRGSAPGWPRRPRSSWSESPLAGPACRRPRSSRSQQWCCSAACASGHLHQRQHARDRPLVGCTRWIGPRPPTRPEPRHHPPRYPVRRAPHAPEPPRRRWAHLLASGRRRGSHARASSTCPRCARRDPNVMSAEVTRGYPVVPVAPRSALPIARASDGHQRRRKGDRHFESLDLT